MCTLYITEAYCNPKRHINKLPGVQSSQRIEHINQEVAQLKQR